MANVNKLAPFILKWEGGFVNDPLDRGGATNMGVTISTWKKVGYDKNGDGCIDVQDLRMLSPDDVIDRVLKPNYWDRWKADQINNQSIANILVDWVWGSGKWGIVIPQRILGVVQDGMVGNQTLQKINGYDQKVLFELIKQERIKFIQSIVASKPNQKRFEKGWMNRLNDLKFQV